MGCGDIAGVCGAEVEVLTRQNHFVVYDMEEFGRDHIGIALKSWVCHAYRMLVLGSKTSRCIFGREEMLS